MTYSDEQLRLMMTGYPDGYEPPRKSKPRRNKSRNRTRKKMQRRSRKLNR